MPRRENSSCRDFGKAAPETTAFAERGDVAARGGGRVEQDLEEVRRAAIGDRAEGLDELELLLGVAGPGRDDRAAERARGGIEDEAAGRQVIAEGVEHHVAGAEAGRVQRARAAPRIGLARPPARRSGPGEVKSRPKEPGGAATKPPKGGAALCRAGRSDLRSTGRPAQRRPIRHGRRIDARRAARHRPAPPWRAEDSGSRRRDRPRGRPDPGCRGRRRGRSWRSGGSGEGRGGRSVKRVRAERASCVGVSGASAGWSPEQAVCQA